MFTMKKNLLFILLFLFILIILLLIYLFSSRTSNDFIYDWFDIGNVDKIDKSAYRPAKDVQTYYVLDKLQFFAIPSIKKLTYVEIVASLAYPRNSVEHENDIIFHREEIKDYIQNFFSQKTFNQISSIDNRQRMKNTIIYGINQILNYKITNLYFVRFFTIQRDNRDY